MSAQEQEDVTKMIFEDTLLEVPKDVAETKDNTAKEDVTVSI
jgi:hypothetical protein